jgi:hypothetical protein
LDVPELSDGGQAFYEFTNEMRPMQVTAADIEMFYDDLLTNLDPITGLSQDPGPQGVFRRRREDSRFDQKPVSDYDRGTADHRSGPQGLVVVADEKSGFRLLMRNIAGGEKDETQRASGRRASGTFEF